MPDPCRHRQSLTIHPISRGPRTTVQCDTCGARWEVDSGIVVLVRLVLDRQDAIVARFLDDDEDGCEPTEG